MTIVYQQTTGQLWINGTKRTVGYSGINRGRNKHEFQYTSRLGPIPVGLYHLSDGGDQQGYASPTLFSIACVPAKGTETKGRSGFFIHGDNSTGTASTGCIIVNREVRKEILSMIDGNKTLLTVIQ